MVQITTPAEWWVAVEEHKEHLIDMVASYHPGGPRTGGAMTITAGAAELACQQVREQIASEPDSGDPVDKLKKAIEEQDWQTAGRIFSATWFGVPESQGAWSIPSFGVLCDLCSENWVFQEEEQDAERS